MIASTLFDTFLAQRWSFGLCLAIRNSLTFLVAAPPSVIVLDLAFDIVVEISPEAENTLVELGKPRCCTARTRHVVRAQGFAPRNVRAGRGPTRVSS